MKSLQEIGAVLLIPVILFSSFGFTIDVHYCNGEVKSIGFLSEAEACDMGGLANEIFESLPPCHQKKLKEQNEKIKNTQHKNGDLKSNCCHNHTFIFESNQEIEQTDAEISLLDVQVMMLACIFSDYSFFFDNYQA